MRWIFFYLAVLSLSLSYIGCSKQHNVETIQNVTTEPSAYSENDKEIIEDTDEDKLNVNDSIFMKLGEIYDNMLLKSGESKCLKCWFVCLGLGK